VTINKSLLVLDLDETLVRAVETPLDRLADFRVSHFHVYLRPHAKLFIETCFSNFEVAVWSSASEPYVAQVVKEIFPNPEELIFVWGSSKVTHQRSLPYHYEKFGGDLDEFHNQKRLAKLKQFGWPLERILIVDDSPEKSAQNYGNVIHPKPFLGEEDDTELAYLASYLELLSSKENVRSIEKRTWKNKVGPKNW
jgi:RNA polymerase II subunit A small phosphatase-like protein